MYEGIHVSLNSEARFTNIWHAYVNASTRTTVYCIVGVKYGMMSADLFAKLDDKPKETRILTRMLLSYIATKNFSKALTAGMRILRVTDDPALKRLTEMRIATIKGQMEGKDTVTTTGGRGGGRAFQSQHARRESNMARIKVRLRVCVCATSCFCTLHIVASFCDGPSATKK